MYLNWKKLYIDFYKSKNSFEGDVNMHKALYRVYRPENI